MKIPNVAQKQLGDIWNCWVYLASLSQELIIRGPGKVIKDLETNGRSCSLSFAISKLLFQSYNY